QQRSQQSEPDNRSGGRGEHSQRHLYVLRHPVGDGKGSASTLAKQSMASVDALIRCTTAAGSRVGTGLSTLERSYQAWAAPWNIASNMRSFGTPIEACDWTAFHSPSSSCTTIVRRTGTRWPSTSKCPRPTSQQKLPSHTEAT